MIKQIWTILTDLVNARKVAHGTAKTIPTKVYQPRTDAEISNRDLLRIMLIINSNRPLTPKGVEIPKGFAAIARYQYDQLPEDLQGLFVEVEVEFKVA